MNVLIKALRNQTFISSVTMTMTPLSYITNCTEQIYQHISGVAIGSAVHNGPTGIQGPPTAWTVIVYVSENTNCETAENHKVGLIKYVICDVFLCPVAWRAFVLSYA